MTEAMKVFYGPPNTSEVLFATDRNEAILNILFEYGDDLPETIMVSRYHSLDISKFKVGKYENPLSMLLEQMDEEFLHIESDNSTTVTPKMEEAQHVFVETIKDLYETGPVINLQEICSMCVNVAAWQRDHDIQFKEIKPCPTSTGSS